MNQSVSDSSEESAPNPRKRRLVVLAAIVVAGGCAWLVFSYWGRGESVTTDNAYVSGDLVQITSDVAGTAIAVHVNDTASVERDQLLVELDPIDAQLAVDSAEAKLARSVREVRGLFAQVRQLRAQLVEREFTLQRAENDLKRRRGLVSSGAVSSEVLAHSEDAVTEARAAVAVSQEQLNAALVQIEGTTVATHPAVVDAAAGVRDALLALQRTRLTAPVGGVVARRSVQLGQRISAGTPLLTVVPLTQVWVDANFREVQLGRVRVGQPVLLRADLYGKEVEYHGNVVGLAAGSGSAFALLPAQNASGNWIKIVQRVPVRISIDPKELQAHPLRIGLSMTATIDVREISGAPIATQARAAEPATRASLRDDPQVARRIADIIAQNQLSAPETSAAFKPVQPVQRHEEPYAKKLDTELAATRAP